MQLKDFIPPIVIRAARRFVHGCPPCQSPVFKSYDAAASECVGFGYETSELVDIVCRKTAIYRNQLASTGPARLAGGDTPAMVNRAAELETDELRFFDSITDAAAGFDFVDVAFSSGTLQCVPNAKQALQEILNPQPRFVVLARLGLTAAAVELVTIHETRLSHNGPGPLPPGCKDGTTRYPFIFPVQSEIESILSKQYRIILSAPDPSGVFPVNDEPLIGMGYIGRISDHAGQAFQINAKSETNG